MPKSSNYTTTVTIPNNTAPATKILSIDPKSIDSVLITGSADWFLGFGDATQAIYPVLASAVFSMSHLDFRLGTNTLLDKIYTLLHVQVTAQRPIQPYVETVDLYAIPQANASLTIYITYLGGNV
jgi:hypothetical protein